MKLRSLPITVVALLVSGLMATVTAAPAASAAAGHRLARSAAGGTQLWVATHTVSGHSSEGYAVAVSPDGSRVYVTGAGNTSPAFTQDTVAYNSATGARLWVAHLRRPGGTGFTDGQSLSDSIAVSPDGSTVFVIANFFEDTISGHTTVAYSAATGARLWMVTDTRGNAQAVAASPDGSTVFITGDVLANAHCETVAYHATTGATLWTRFFRAAHSGRNIDCIPTDVAVSPDGSAVFITGYDFDTVAYDAATGATLWARHYGPGAKAGGYYNNGTSAAVTPDGSKVLVTGGFFRGISGSAYATVAFDAATGAKLWVRRYSQPTGAGDVATAIAVSPDGSKAFVTGWSRGASSASAYATVAYGTATGITLWVRRYNQPTGAANLPTAIAVSPDGSQVFVTGQSQQTYATVAYGTACGTLSWTARYGARVSIANAVTPSPDGSKVFVTGVANSRQGLQTYATIAYST